MLMLFKMFVGKWNFLPASDDALGESHNKFARHLQLESDFNCYDGSVLMALVGLTLRAYMIGFQCFSGHSKGSLCNNEFRLLFVFLSKLELCYKNH